MTISYVAKIANDTASNNLSHTPSAGNSLILYLGGDAGTAEQTISDDQGNTWTNAVYRDSTRMVQISWATNVAGAATYISWTTGMHRDLLEVSSGADLELDQTNSADDAGTAHSPGNITPGHNDVLIVNAFRFENAPGTITWNDSFTSVHDGIRLATGYRIVSGSAGTLDGDVVIQTSRVSSCAIASFNEVGGGGGVTIPVMMHHYTKNLG